MFLRAIVISCFVLQIWAQTCNTTSVCTSPGNSNNWECQTGNFVVQVNGNQQVPKYSFFLSGNGTDDYTYGSSSVDGEVYKIQFSQLNELADGQKTSTFSLSSLSWQFTTPKVVDTSPDKDCTSTETQFEITSQNDPKANFESITFVNHLADSNNTSSLKFDVIITNYQWQDASSDSLELLFTYTGGSANDNATYTNSTTYSVGTSYISINPVAYGYVDLTDPSVNQTVSVTFDADGKFGFIYSKFNGSLVHDPTIGIDTDSDDGDDNWWIWVIVGVAGAVFVIAVIVAVVALLVIRQRRSSYKSVD
jgi:hypothetical protein